MNKPNDKTTHAVLIRFPVELHQKLRERADEEGRSLTKHVIQLAKYDVREAA